MTRPAGRTQGYVYGLLSGVTWGVVAVLLEQVYRNSPPDSPLTTSLVVATGHDAAAACFLVSRLAVAGALVSALRVVWSRSGAMIAICGLLGGVVFMSGYVIALDLSGPTYALTVTAMYPVLGALFARALLDQRLNQIAWLGVVAAAAGTALTAFDAGSTPQGLRTLGGVAIALAAATGLALEGVVATKVMASVDPDGAMAVRQVFSAVLLALIVVAIPEGRSVAATVLASAHTAIPLLVAGAVGGYSFAVWYRSIRTIGVAKAMALNITYAMWGIVFAWVLAQSTTRPLVVVGCVVVTAGAVLVVMSEEWRSELTMTNPKRVSILKESRDGDLRVIALPREVEQFVANGYEVRVETGAGLGQGIPDERYREAGALVVDTEEAWMASDVLFKCRCPSEAEYTYFRPGLHLGATFYLGDKPELADVLGEHRVNAYSYEMFEDDDGTFPLMITDSEISGHMAVIYAAYHLQDQLGGSGTMLGRLPGVKPSRVLVIGHGNAGAAAARAAAALGADVTVVGTSRTRLRRFAATMPANVECVLNDPEVLGRVVPECDVVIGAIRISNFGTEAIVTEDMVSRMRPGSVVVDVTCGYGPGYLPTATYRTRHLTEAYQIHGVTHIKNDCMPKLVYLTATPAMSRAAFPHLLALAESVYEGTPDPVSGRGQITRDGIVVHPHIVDELRLKEATVR